MVSSTKVILVGPLPPPSGGMANQTRQLARLLAGEGVEVVLVQVNASYRPAWLGAIRGLRALVRLLPYLRALWQACTSGSLVHVMANSGWSWHLFAAPAVWIGHLRGAAVVVNYRGGEAEAFFARSWRWVQPTLARANAVVVPSRFLQRVFERRGVATRVVPNVIDLDRFTPATERSTPGFHLVVTRNLEAIYDNATALRAFARLRETFPEARLTIAGSGPLRETLEALARELDVDQAVTFTGRLDNERMMDLYQRADLMLNASLVDNMPISILEALACAVPVVSTRAGGIPDLVEDGRSALLVPLGDAEAMATAARRVLESAALAQRLRREGLALVARFAWPAVRGQLFDVYGELTSHSFHCPLKVP